MDDHMPTSEEEWKAKLTPEQYRILREKGTEQAFTGEYYDSKEKGTYTCAGCGTPLFDSDMKYDSGSGWPSFTQSVGENTEYKTDESHGMIRTEVLCKKCGGHLGHVFDDGPGENGKRYCINSACLNLNTKNA